MISRRRHILFYLVGVLVSGIVAGVVAVSAHAATPTGGFSLEVTPSPLVATVKPGMTTSLDIKIHNTGTNAEDLKIEPRRFTVDDKSGHISLQDSTPPEITDWLSFATPQFTVRPGEWYTQKMQLAIPAQAGYSYSFALLISRVHQANGAAGRVINGSLAVFTLINVDRPGAMRKLEIEDFSSSQGIYEYLPATLNIILKNTGNSIIQPYGNIFIQRDTKDKASLSTLPVNDKKGYILPGSSRTLATQWQDGFPVEQATTGADGAQKTASVWDWSKLGNFRIGRYTAKLVAVYNDGQRDIPIEREVTFWVFPWKIIGGMILLITIFSIGLWSLLRGTWLFAHRKKRRRL
jgi:hypothetical protein